MKSNFENLTPPLSDIETKEYEMLVKLWKKYHFLGNPPSADAPVTRRLYDTCKKYAEYILNEEISRKETPDSENYFQKTTKKPPSSDLRRRELHNEIAIMVLGRQRTGMDERTALDVSDFATLLTHGYDLKGLEELRKKDRDEQVA